MHPTTPPTPSRRAPRAPKNPRRRVRSESDRKKHAGWRHCPRCNRSVSTNGRNFYHHMHKCDRVYFADLIAKVDSAVTPVSTPLPPPVPRPHNSPITPTRIPNITPVKMSETQRVIFLQQLCFLRVYDRTVDAVLNQIEQTDASIFSPAAFEAVRRAKGIETPQRVFPNPKSFSPPYSPLAPPVHPNASSNPALVTSQPVVITATVNGTSNMPNGPQPVNTPYSSNGSISISAPIPGNPNSLLSPAGTPTHIISSPLPSGNGSAPVMPQRQPTMQRHSIAGVPSSNDHISPGLPIPASSALPGTSSIPEPSVIPAAVTGNLVASQPTNLHARPITSPDQRAVSEPMGYTHNIGDGRSAITIPARMGVSSEIPVSASVAVPSSATLVQGSEAILGNSGIPQNQQAFNPTGNIITRNSSTRANLATGSSMDPTVGSDGNWHRDSHRFSVPAGTTPFSSAPYGTSVLPSRSQMPVTPNISASAAAVANTPVSRVASAMSISSVINT